jgi:hypothetical protein
MERSHSDLDPRGASAESLASIAAQGRRHTWVFWLDGPWEEFRALKGPVMASPITKDHDHTRELWDGRRPLRVTVASDALRDEPELCQRLLSLARFEQIDMCIGPDAPVDPIPRGVRSYEWIEPPGSRPGPIASLTTSIIRVSLPDGWAEHGVLLEHQWRQAAATLVGGTSGPGEAERTFLEMKAHESLEHDMFVTTNVGLLGGRFGQGRAHGLGVFNPREAVTTTEILLRARRLFVPYIDDRATFTLGSPMTFYGILTQAKMPQALAALRSCLSPQRVASMRLVADHLETIGARYEDLLVAHDELGRLAQLEGHMNGNNQIRHDQLYHLQYAFVLVTGLLDTVAWIVTAIEGSLIDRRHISWRALLNTKSDSWSQNLTDASAIAIRDAARRHRHRPFMELIHELRDAVQHRQPIAAVTVEAKGPSMAISPPAPGPTLARMSVLDLEACLAPVVRSAPPVTPGLIEVGGSQFLMPHRLARGLVDSTADFIDDVLAGVNWPHAAGWWEQEVAEKPDFLARVDWLFGQH